MTNLIRSIYAADIPLGPEVSGVGPFQTGITGGAKAGLGNLLSSIITTLTIVGGLAFVIFFFIGGLKWITAGGDKANVEAARSRISNALVGLAVIAAAWAVTLLVEYIFGFNVLGGVTLPTFY